MCVSTCQVEFVLKKNCLAIGLLQRSRFFGMFGRFPSTYEVCCIHDAIFNWQGAVNGEMADLLLLLSSLAWLGLATLRLDCFLHLRKNQSAKSK